jgi:hypothetical protein
MFALQLLWMGAAPAAGVARRLHACMHAGSYRRLKVLCRERLGRAASRISARSCSTMNC